MKYRLSQLAEDDLVRIYLYGKQKFGTNQAIKYNQELFETFELIARNPEAFPKVDFIKPNFRRCVCGSDSIYYKIGEDDVEIMTIIGSQDF